jgi:anti-sigma regulatory factor (Ser/Thr protein kinase)
MSGPATHGTRWFLPSTPAAVGIARDRAVASLRLWGIYLDPDCEDSVRLLVSELVTNAVLHDPGPLVTVGLYVGVNEQTVMVEVLDGNRDQPAVRRAGEQAEGGRGLFLVDALTSGRWGTTPTAKGKRVWGALPLPDQPRAARRRQLLDSLIRAARPNPYRINATT